MGTILLIVASALLVLVIYFNIVATILVFKAPASAPLFNIFRAMIIWLLPIVGFMLFLRLTRQAYDSDLHYKLVPGFAHRWFYDDSSLADNPNADRNYDQARRFASSERHVEYKKKL